MEASHWNNHSRNIGDGGDVRYPRVTTFDRIIAARATKSEDTSNTFMSQLFGEIRWHCQRLRKGAVAELEAQDTPGDTYHTGPPRIATSNHSSRKQSSVASDSDEDTSSSSQDEAEHGQIESDPSSPSTSEISETELPTHEYTSILWEHAAQSGKQPQYTMRRKPNAWICEVRFDGTCKKATARNKREARHCASQMLCQALRLS